MLDQLNYRFVSYEKEKSRRAYLQDYRSVSPEDDRKEMHDMNERTVDRLKNQFELFEDSTVHDLRVAVRRLTEETRKGK